MSVVEQDPADGERTARHFLGVTDSGLRIGLEITSAWTLPLEKQHPLPMSAVHEEFSALSGSEPPDALFRADGSPMLWPVSAAVYRAFHEEDDENGAASDGWDLPDGYFDDDEDDG